MKELLSGGNTQTRRRVLPLFAGLLLVALQLPAGAAVAPVTVYQNCNYGGYAVGLSVGSYTSTQLRALGILPADLSSAQVTPGYRITLYSKDAFSGTSLQLTSNDSCFVADQFNDLAYSAVVSAVPAATVYQDCNYGGYAVKLPVGSYTSTQLRALGILPADLSSAQVPSGYQVVLYSADGFSGSSLKLTSNDSCFVADGFNDRAYSAVVSAVSTTAPAPSPSPSPTPPPSTANVTTVYQDCNYGGYAINLPVGSYTSSQLQARGVRLADLSSAMVTSGYQLTLYSSDGFSGSSVTLTSSHSCLVADGFNDLAYSAVVSVAPATPTAPAATIVKVGADTGDWSALIPTINARNPGKNEGHDGLGTYIWFDKAVDDSLQVVSLNGKNYLRSTIRDGEHWSTSSYDRTELATFDDTAAGATLRAGHKYQIEWKGYYPQAFPTTGTFAIMMQIHENNGNSPACSIGVENGYLTFSDDNSGKYRLVAANDYVNTTFTMRITYVPSSGSDGYMRFEMNGKTIFERTGKTTDTPGEDYMKAATLYDWSNALVSPTSTQGRSYSLYTEYFHIYEIAQ